MKPQEPSTVFTTRIEVRVADLNYGGHLGNDRVLAFFHEGRVRWLQALGLSELDVGGVGIIQTEAHLVFRRQAFLGDLLRLSVEPKQLRSRGFTLQYHLHREGDEIARGSTVLLFFDYKNQQTAKAPAGFFDRLKV